MCKQDEITTVLGVGLHLCTAIVSAFNPELGKRMQDNIAEAEAKFKKQKATQNSNNCQAASSLQEIGVENIAWIYEELRDLLTLINGKEPEASETLKEAIDNARKRVRKTRDKTRLLTLWLGCITESIEKQLREQGYTADKERLKEWQEQRTMINKLHLRNLISDGEHNKAQHRLFKSIMTEVVPL